MRVPGHGYLPVEWSAPYPGGYVFDDGPPAARSVQHRAQAAVLETPALDELREWLDSRKSGRPVRVEIG